MTKPYLQPVAPHTVNGTVPLWPRGGVGDAADCKFVSGCVTPFCSVILFCLKNFVFEFVTVLARDGCCYGIG
jgi:hypothetical protein